MAEPAIAHAPAAARDRLPLRFVTAASLFDGHDASINIMRRMLQSAGAEVIHLGHNRSVEEIVTATVQEDAHAVAVSSYQGGHVEFFKYLVDQLRERDSAHIRVFGGGGGVIVADEIRELHDYGVSRIYSPADGQQLGLGGLNRRHAGASRRGGASRFVRRCSGSTGGDPGRWSGPHLCIVCVAGMGRSSSPHQRNRTGFANPRAT